MAHVLVYYTLLVVIIIGIVFVKLRKMLENVVKRSEFGYTREYKSYLLLLLSQEACEIGGSIPCATLSPPEQFCIG